MKLSEDIRYVGVNDHVLDLFEGHYIVPDGMAYNSYVIMDEKIAVIDSVDAGFTQEWINKIRECLGDRKPEYLVVQHMEPDHSGSLTAFMEEFKETTVVASGKAFTMMKNFFGDDYSDRRIVACEGSELVLGEHVLKFICAPMVHWPEVIVTYDCKDKILFSADAFGKFGALDLEDDDWECEARRYYFGIVGKYGMQVQNLLKKLANYPIEAIYPLHGPMLTENVEHYIGLYDIWSSYEVETEGVTIAYTSVYGNTKKAVNLLADKLRSRGCEVSVLDLARDDMAEAVEDAFRYGKLVLATTTFNNDIFPYMREFIESLKERNYQKRTIGLIENGSWAPTAAKTMRGMLEGCKGLEFTETTVKIVSALNEESMAQLECLADELCPR